MSQPPIKPVVVLHLEDSDLDAVFVRDRLEQAGFPVAVDRVCDRKGFLAALTARRYDVILSDYRVPGFDGLAALEQTRRHQPDVPFLFVTGAMGEELAVETLRRGATDYVLKDRLARLPAAVERALAEARVEQTLRESEARFRSLFESMDEGYCVVEPVFDAAGRAVDYRYLLANPALEHHTGLTDIVGKTARQLMPSHEAHWIEAYGRVAATGEPVRRTDYVADLDRWYEVSAFPVGGPGGRQVGVLFADVSARHRAEEALRASERRLAEVFRHAPSFMAVLRGPDHVFELANDRYAELVGGRELVGRPVREALPEVVGQGYVELLDRVYRTGEPFAATGARVALERGRGRPAEERFVDFVYQPLQDAGGAVTGILVQGIDQTVRKRAEDALRDADRRKDDFIALLGHELRNPLAPLSNGLQVLRLSDDPGVRDRAQGMMERQLAHMVRLIDDLLDVSRISRNKLELRRARVPLADVVGHAVETARPLLDEAGHTLSVRLPDQPVVLDADPTRLSQVISNLLTNSAKYTPRGGRVWLSAEPGEGKVAVSVRDTGIGIPADALPRIFDMFSQVDRPVERATGGLGIGLALVKGLVEMHGGTVTADSPGVGQGSTFVVTLPVAAAAAAGPAPAANHRPRGPVRRILVADDNRDGAESMAEALRLLGHEVWVAHDGLEAVEQAERFRPEVVLMDVGMPRLNGLDAARQIRERPWGEPVTIIALTGWGQEADRRRSRAAGCDGHLVKPVDLSDLERILVELPEAGG